MLDSLSIFKLVHGESLVAQVEWSETHMVWNGG